MEKKATKATPKAEETENTTDKYQLWREGEYEAVDDELVAFLERERGE